MSERLNKTSICTVIFIGIVDYEQMPVDDQIVFKERFNALINRVVENIPEKDRIILDTGDGAALALLGAPEDALSIAVGIRDGVVQDREQHPERSISVRIGINLGPVRVVNDLNGRLNVVGDGINAAQRVMSFAQPNRILSSRSYFEIASRLSAEMAGMFAYYGIKTDKYVREHEVYSVLDGQPDPLVAQHELPAGEVEAAEIKRMPGRGYWLPVAGAVFAVAIAWGFWVSRAPDDAASGETMAEVVEQPDVDTQDIVNTTSEVSSPERKKTGSSHKARTSNAAVHRDEPSRDEQKTVDNEASQTDLEEQLVTPERNPLCSDAQRMLKQC